MKKLLLGALVVAALAACGKSGETEKVEVAKPMTMEEIVAAAKTEGKVVSVGMPDTWANWKDTWKDMADKYGLEHSDTDLSSAEEIAKFKAEGKNATADIGDVGFEFGEIAVKEGITQPFKPSTWDEIPEWAKDEDGHWALAYTGTISFIVDKTLVDDVPQSWEELLNGEATVSVGDVGIATQSNSALLAAAIAMGGDESNLEPGYDFYRKMAEDGRLALNNPSLSNLEKGEIEVGVIWDFNSLGYRDQIDKERFEVVIPQDGSFISGYTTIINKFAKNPNAAKLTREHIFSDKGQINLARGYAQPVRDVELPADVKEMLLPREMYKNVQPIKDFDAWSVTAAEIPMKWQEEVLYFRK